MIISDLGPKPEPYIGTDSMNVGELSAVVSVGVRELDQFDLVFLRGV